MFQIESYRGSAEIIGFAYFITRKKRIFFQVQSWGRTIKTGKARKENLFTFYDMVI